MLFTEVTTKRGDSELHQLFSVLDSGTSCEFTKETAGIQLISPITFTIKLIQVQIFINNTEPPVSATTGNVTSSTLQLLVS